MARHALRTLDFKVFLRLLQQDPAVRVGSSTDLRRFLHGVHYLLRTYRAATSSRKDCRRWRTVTPGDRGDALPTRDSQPAEDGQMAVMGPGAGTVGARDGPTPG